MSKANSQKIVKEIKEQNIKPESKLKLNWKNYLLWAVVGLVILLGALIFSLVLLDASDIKFGLYKDTTTFKFIRLFIATAPFLLIGLAVVMLVLGVLSWRQTKRGYRHSIIVVAGIMLLLLVGLGVLGHFAKINHRMEKGMAGQLPQFRGPVQIDEERWLQPEQGLLGGEVIVVVTEKISLRDFSGKDWQVYYTTETHMRPGFTPEKGERIGVVGGMRAETEFDAYAIKPFPPQGGKPMWGPGKKGHK